MQKGTELSSEEKYQLLRDISFKIKDTLDLNVILNHLLDSLKTVIHYDAAGIFVLNEAIEHPDYHFPGQKIGGIAKRGYEEHPIESDKMLSEGKGIIGYVINSKESLIIDDVRKDNRYIEGRKKTLSEVAVPIIKNNKAIGALDVESDRLSAFNHHHLEILQFFADASAISLEKAILHHQILEKKKLEEQMQIAKDVQTNLLPSQPPKVKGYNIAGICIPTYEIGGDYYDYIPLDDQNLAIVIADVSGDGIPSALIMSAFRALLYSQINPDKNPSEIMSVLNQQIPFVSRKRDFISVFYAILNFKEHTCTYTNCGHNPPMLLRSNGKIELLEQGSAALNILNDAKFNSDSVILGPGDQIIFYTDGVTEVFNADNVEYGFERLRKIILDSKDQSASEIITNIVNSTKTFSSTKLFRDDFTIIVLKRKMEQK
ncbi:MAG: SpoIIE family protein phosphatase [Ignavibacteriaceae bacterium]|jgi:sigma-B regulation protein RsbU (phosphoserine phosphatase)|nr:SpoIIE family protein phosphatase [Ignavibacteriaceae bacterium]